MSQRDLLIQKILLQKKQDQQQHQQHPVDASTTTLISSSSSSSSTNPHHTIPSSEKHYQNVLPIIQQQSQLQQEHQQNYQNNNNNDCVKENEHNHKSVKEDDLILSQRMHDHNHNNNDSSTSNIFNEMNQLKEKQKELEKELFIQTLESFLKSPQIFTNHDLSLIVSSEMIHSEHHKSFLFEHCILFSQTPSFYTNHSDSKESDQRSTTENKPTWKMNGWKIWVQRYHIKDNKEGIAFKFYFLNRKEEKNAEKLIVLTGLTVSFI